MSVPFVRAIVATSADGCISADASRMPDFTSAEDWDLLQRELAHTDAVVVGRRTYVAAQERLDTRTTIVVSRSGDVPVHPHNVHVVNPDTVRCADVCASYQHVAILGGTAVYEWAFAQNMVHELWLTIEPVLLGGGVPFIHMLPSRVQLVLKEIRRLNERGTVLMIYTVEYEHTAD
jgi:dihydrofolate reductase